MKFIRTAQRVAQEALPFDAWSSFNVPQSRAETGDYLNEQHRDSLRADSEITDWKILGEEYVEGVGTLRRLGFVTAQGYSYAAIIGVPEHPESTIPVIGTSAWFTSVEGHNEYTLRNLVRAGNYMFFVGAEGSYEPEHNLLTHNSPISLANSAAAVLNFAHHSALELKLEGHNVDLVKRSVVGESRGAMTGMGIIALAEEFAQEVVFADLVAPCLPRPMKLSDVRALSEQLVTEPKEIAKLVGRMTLGRMQHYPATLDLSPYSLKHQLAIGFALFSGEAGLLAQHISPEILMHITTFDNDFASMRYEWEEIFKDHPNIRITPLPGSHLTLADLETLQYIIGRNKAAQICLTEQEALTPKSVFDAAHLFAPNQNPIPYGPFEIIN